MSFSFALHCANGIYAQYPITRVRCLLNTRRNHFWSVIMIKSIFPAIVMASALAIPAASHAQDNSTPTRAEVKADLQQTEQAGYNPSGDHASYPRNAQAAEGQVGARQAAGYQSYGGASTTGSQSYGTRMDIGPMSGPRSPYFGH
jgi:hypothetical protein